MPSPEQLRRLREQIAPGAVASEAATQVPAVVQAAQCIIESEWLAKMSGPNNPFGIKGNSSNGVLVTTHEWFTQAEMRAFVAKGEGRMAELDGALIRGGRQRYLVRDYFRRFDSLAEAFTAHANLLLNGAPYRLATQRYLTDGDLSEYIHKIGAVYATDPNYGATLEKIATSAAVTEAIAAARKEPPMPNDPKQPNPNKPTDPPPVPPAPKPKPLTEEEPPPGDGDTSGGDDDNEN